MTHLPHLAARILGTPLMVEHARMETILSVLGPRIGLLAAGTMPALPDPVSTSSLLVTQGGIALVPIHGTLAKRVGAVEAASGLTSYAAIEEMILDAATDPAVRAILLDIDSPGGEVGGVFDLAALIKEASASKPVWALANDAYSAAYLLASTAQRLYLPQTAGVGSVGVIAVHVDETERDAKEGRKYTSIFAGSSKNDYSRHTPLSTEASQRLQSEVDRLYGLFVQAVARNRNLSTDAVRATEARVFFGENAIAVGLADQVGTLRNALADLSAFITPTLHKEFRMETPIPEASASTQVPDPSSATQFQHNAQAIVDLCALADTPQMAGEFIARGMSAELVRKELLNRRAVGVEITSHVLPGEGTRVQPDANLDHNPMVTACRKLATQHPALGGV